ncbi:unnamed protein product [Aphanomyces euteiches]
MSNAQWGHTFNIDWIALIKAPTITKVRGCIDQYFISQDRSDPIADIALVMNLTNDVLPVFSTNFESMDLPFASTYNCMAGDTVRIQGRNFGDTSLVRINGQPCEGQPLISQAILADDTDVEEVISCVLPPGPPGLVTVTVQNERYRGLQFDGAFLSYAVPADLSTSSTVSNVMAYAVDITWAPPPSLWTCLTVTGYEITWFVSSDLSSSKSKMVGNVTTTTLLPLLPSTVYSVTVAAVVESQQPIAGILLSLQLNSDGYSARGGDGFAFVVQNVGQEAIGEGGFHLGYGGIPNSLSVEFDTTYNPEMLDLYENHISVHTRGYDVANSGDHSYSLGATSQ